MIRFDNTHTPHPTIIQKKMQKQQQQPLKHFLHKYSQQLTQQLINADPATIKAHILTPQQITEAASLIQSGELVAFPTQTVYGLGANAYNPEALKKIYETKKRPLTDPIIVHVLDTKQGEELVIMGDKQRVVFQLLTKQFWPGPLTIILKANLDKLPLIVTAQTGFVGIRAPKHPYARSLIEASKLPIGAPSANLFSHVSPTEPVHVFNDFYDCPISIVDGERCEFGVESTVIKLVEDQIHVFREGSLSIKKLQSYLKTVLSDQKLPKVIVHSRVQNKHINMQAPGQLLKHYAPYLPCYYLTNSKKTIQYSNKDGSHRFPLSESAFISFDHDQFIGFAAGCKFYFQAGSHLVQQSQDREDEQQLFCSKQEKALMRQVYYLLRKCQNLNAQAIVIGWSHAKEGTVWDKIFRSTQGQQIIPI